MPLSVRSRYADWAGRSHGPSESGVQHELHGPLHKTGCGLAEAGQPEEKLTNKLLNACQKTERERNPLRAAPQASSTSSSSSSGPTDTFSTRWGAGGRFHTDHCTSSSSSRLRRCLSFSQALLWTLFFRPSWSARFAPCTRFLLRCQMMMMMFNGIRSSFFPGVMFSKFVWKDNKILPKVASSCSQFMRPYHAVLVQELAQILFSYHVSVVNSIIMRGEAPVKSLESLFV